MEKKYERLLDFAIIFSDRNSCKQRRNLALLGLNKTEKVNTLRLLLREADDIVKG